MHKISSLVCGIFVIAGVQLGQAQNLGVSPYSKLGIGDVNDNPGNVRNFGMGNLGVSTPHPYHINIANPAWLVFNNRVTFEMAGTGQAKKIASSNESRTTGNGGLSYLALSLPVAKRWKTAVGLRPFSSVNYESFTTSTVADDPNNTPVVSGVKGEGNLSEVFFGNGVSFGKDFSIGVTGSYIFGSIDRNSYSMLRDETGQLTNQRSIINERTTYNDFIFKGGAAYRKELNKKLNVNIGAVYGLETKFDFERRTVLERRDAGDNLQDLTSAGDTTSGNVTLPTFFQGGISFDNNSSWSLGLEFAARDWTGFNPGGPGSTSDLGKSYRIALGGEFTPDPTSFDSYLKRIAYRGGLSFAKTPHEPFGEKLNDISLHAGVTLPIGSVPRPPEYNLSFINLGVAVGKMGTTENNLLSETYVRFMVGVSLNSVWFIKPKID